MSSWKEEVLLALLSDETIVSGSAPQKDRRCYRYYIGLQPSHISTRPAEHAECSTCTLEHFSQTNTTTHG